jgi:hypothetical protein
MSSSGKAPARRSQTAPRSPQAPAAPAPQEHDRRGLKDRVATTLYLLPPDHQRLRKLAIDRNVSFQTLVLDALDLLLDRNGEKPVARWETRRKAR